MKSPLILPLTATVFLSGCTHQPVPNDPRLLAELERIVIPNTSTWVTDGELATGLYFVVDSGYGYPRKNEWEVLYIDPSPIVTAGNLTRIRTDNSPDDRLDVVFEMDSIGSARWQVATRRCAGDRVAIVVQNEVVSAPTVTEEIPLGRASFDPGPNSSISAVQFAEILKREKGTVPPVR